MSRRPPPVDNLNWRQPSNDGSHPYALMAPQAVPVVSSRDEDQEEECPVCLEPLSFSFRLPGEKPHVVPECGHALHEACFAAVYGPLPARAPPGGTQRKANLGVCGVCRRPMRVSEGDQSGGKSNKLAALTGMLPTSPPSTGAGSPTNGNDLYPGRDKNGTVGHRGAMGTTAMAKGKKETRGPNDDDPLDRMGSSMKSGSGHGHSHSHSHSRHGGGGDSGYIVTPSIQARAEFPTIARNLPAPSPTDTSSLSHNQKDANLQPLTCIVVVELPSRRSGPQHIPGQSQVGMSPMGGQEQYSSHRPPAYVANPGHIGAIAGSENGRAMGSSNGPTPTPSTTHMYARANGQAQAQNGDRTLARKASQATTDASGDHRPGSPSSQTSFSHRSSSPIGSDGGPDASPFRAITDDLQNRIMDWKGHSLSALGPLQLYDHLHVRRDHILRGFYVYLFKEALICVLEEKKRGFARLPFGGNSDASSNATVPSKGILRLKGRIFVRHIRNVTDTSVLGELSLTIDMEDEKLESFILIYKERGSLETWKNKVMTLVRDERSRRLGSSSIGSMGTMGTMGTMEEFGGRNSSMSGARDRLPPGVGGKAARMLSGSTTNSGTTYSSLGGDSLTSSAARNTVSSTTTASSYGERNYSLPLKQGQHNSMGMIEEDSGYGESGGESNGVRSGPMTPLTGGTHSSYPNSPPPPHSNGNLNNNLVAPHITHGPSNSLPNLPHTPMDILLILSVPPPSAPRSTALLKIRVLKTTLDFVLASLGGGDRLSIVTFEIGVGGRVRKTPFLRVGSGNGDGTVRLARFIETLGKYDDGEDAYGGANNSPKERDEFEVKTGKEEKTDVVTAVNHGLDVVLQRKQRNPISSILLVSDAADSARRAQMDLVLARAEAANIAIHSFGYGRSHDPASLWLMSNHTSGTYTFVKEWYDLRDCLAGCLGGMMSVALLNTKLHLKVVDGHRFKIRKVSGVGNSIVASDGQNVDVELGELRYGERKEMLVELDLDNSDDYQRMQRMGSNMGMNSAYRSGSSHGGNGGRSSRRALNGTDQFMERMGLDSHAFGDTGDLMDGMMERMIDEVPVFELDGSYYDPAAGKTVSRLAHPVLLTVTLLPPAGSRPKTPNGPSDPVIVRRRMELFASDMITRALVLVSKKQYPQAHKILFDTRRILNTALQNITQGLPPPSNGGATTVRNRKEMLVLQAVRTLQSIQQDVQLLSEALDENVEGFAYDQRNFGAQQAMILRDQKCWSGRTATERLFFSVDNAVELVARSTDWVSGRE